MKQKEKGYYTFKNGVFLRISYNFNKTTYISLAVAEELYIEYLVQGARSGPLRE